MSTHEAITAAIATLPPHKRRRLARLHRLQKRAYAGNWSTAAHHAVRLVTGLRKAGVLPLALQAVAS